MTWAVLWLSLLRAAPPAQDPFAEESLNYSVNWPSGLSLGEASLRSRRVGDRWELEFRLEAAVPGFEVSDHHRSIAAEEFCSLELEKQFRHGKRTAEERTTFDAQRSLAVRETLRGGGKSEMPAPPCARDALAFLYYLRRELAHGRLPPAQEIFFGARYRVSLQYAGARTVLVNEAPMQAEGLRVSLKGPASEHEIELFFARDAVRTPLLVRATLPLGTFTMELVR